MKFKPMNIPAAGTWARDGELISISNYNGLTIAYHNDENDSYWSIQCEVILGYKVISYDFSRVGYLENLPTEGTFFEIIDSPWIKEFEPYKLEFLDKCKHYIFRFYDHTIEVIAQIFTFEQLKEKPTFSIDLKIL